MCAPGRLKGCQGFASAVWELFFTGDFLQLPPVNRGSLAQVIDEDGVLAEIEDEGSASLRGDPESEKERLEQRARVTSSGARSKM